QSHRALAAPLNDALTISLPMVGCHPGLAAPWPAPTHQLRGHPPAMPAGPAAATTPPTTPTGVPSPSMLPPTPSAIPPAPPGTTLPPGPLTLEQAIALAFGNNGNVTIAPQYLVASRQRAPRARAGRLPHV